VLVRATLPLAEMSAPLAPEGAAAFDSGGELLAVEAEGNRVLVARARSVSSPGEHPHRACRHPSRTTTVIARSKIPGSEPRAGVEEAGINRSQCSAFKGWPHYC
jgi:hypothetical protein